MSFLDLTRTIHMPVRADGRLLKNAFGLVIAEIKGTPTDAAAMADLINLAQPIAEKQAADHYAAEDRLALKHTKRPTGW